MPLLMLLCAGLLVWLTGCGSEHTPPPSSARAVVAVQWPARGRLIPTLTNCLGVEIRNNDGFSSTQLLDRPADGGGSQAVFDPLPVGTLQVIVRAYPNAGGAGTPLAGGTTQIITRAGQQATVALTLQSTIAQLRLSRNTLTLQTGETAALIATPVSSDGATVLTAPGSISWSSSDTGVASVSADGVVSAVAPGSTVITAVERESGKQGSATVTVPSPGRIVFLSDRDGNPEIYSMRPDGSDVKRLTVNSANEDELSVSADGTKIAFISDRDGNFEVYTMNIDGANQRRLTNSTNDDWGPSFSPDGSQVLYFETLDSDEIFIMNADGSNKRQLTYNYDFDVLPVMTPDGTKIVFDSDRDGSTAQGNYEVYIMNADGSGQTRLTTNEGQDWYHAISPDGRCIVYTSGDHLSLMNLDGSGKRQLTFPSGYQDMRPNYSPDGTKIVFASTRDGQSEIYVMNADGSGQTRLTNNGARDWNPAWAK